MSSLKFTEQAHWDELEGHLTGGRGERFAFAHTRLLTPASHGPIVEVLDVELIDDSDIDADGTGWYLAETALDRIHNAAVAGGYGLIEFHNHRFGPPVFSRTDEAGLAPMSEYVTTLLPDRVCGAGVYGGGRLYVEHWIRSVDGTRREPFRSVTVLGDNLRLVNASTAPENERLNRQTGLLGEWGSATLASIRVAVVGAGGTGSHAALAAAYLGVGDVLVLDDDHVEITNLNRLVTAGNADIGAPKSLVARRRMREIDPRLNVTVLPALTPDGRHPELDDVDLIIGCVDHDGPRDRLNQIAVNTATPFIDIATGVDITHTPPAVGGRVIVVAHDGPCLHCLGELDAAEVSRWTKDPGQQALDRQHGYGTAGANPSVVHLNGVAVHAAFAELTAWISGHRPPAQYLDIDLSGLLAGRVGPSGCRVTPRQPAEPAAGCIACDHRRRGRVTES